MNKTKFRIEGDHRIFLLLTLWSVVVLMLMCIDSPLHHIYNRIDSGWFFMCGKAMMNGLRPYVDFTDSKGPLLWLIYGIGYLISPHSYFGVYVLACLCYGGILYYNYKTALLLLGDDRRSLMVALLMPWFYFLYWFCDDIRAEDFCNLPLSASLYYLLHLLYNKEGQSYSVRRYGLVLGGSFMVLVLIKWNVAAMQALMIGVALWYYVSREHSLSGLMKWMTVGMAVVGLPFLSYLVVLGSFGGFVQEYFVNTLQTVSSSEGTLASFWNAFLKSWTDPKKQAFLLFIVGGGWLAGRLLPYWRHLPWMIGLWFYLLSTQHNLPHYYSMCYLFCLFPLIYFVSMMTRPLKAGYIAAAITVVIGWGIFENTREKSPLTKVTRWCSGNNKLNYDYLQRISHALDGVHKPRIINLYGTEYGFGVEQESLPAGKHWTYQLGMTPAMAEEHIALLKSGKADFVVVGNEKRCNNHGFTRKVIESYGYQQVLHQKYVYYRNAKRTAAIYRKKNM